MKCRRRSLAPFASLALLAIIPAVGAARAPSIAIEAVDRVEEDWELVVEQPDLTSEGPQITTVMSTTGDRSGMFVAFNLNYRDQPAYEPGGLEVVGYEGEVVVASSPSQTQRLETPNETITWTQRFSVDAGELRYQIDHGASTTWGRFGQDAGVHLAVTFPQAGVGLAGYTPEASIANSGVGWQPNRVSRMSLKQVRYYSGGNLIALDPTPREIVLGGGGRPAAP